MIKLPARIWSDDFKVVGLAPLPVGYAARSCPKCGKDDLTGAIIHWTAGPAAIPDTSEVDPNILCLACGYWADALPESGEGDAGRLPPDFPTRGPAVLNEELDLHPRSEHMSKRFW
jgi:hypothetical protein